MAEKISMLIVRVDLDCHKCYEKMRKILCKLQDQERIRTISYDDKNKTIAIAGPFDPHRLACKIRCKAGKVVKDIQIIDNNGCARPPPPPAPVNNCKQKQKQKEKAAAAEPAPPPAEPAPAPAPALAPASPPPSERPPSPPSQPHPPDRERTAMVPSFVEEKKPKAKPAELEPSPPPSPKEKPVALPPLVEKQRPPTPPLPAAKPPPEHHQQPVEEYVVPTVEIPSWPAAPMRPCGCPCCAPCYQGYYEGCRCYCGRVYGYAVAVPPAPPGCGYQGCRVFSDEDPNAACSIM